MSENTYFGKFKFSGRTEFFDPYPLGELKYYERDAFAYRLGFARGCRAGSFDALHHMRPGEDVMQAGIEAAFQSERLMQDATPFDPDGDILSNRKVARIKDANWQMTEPATGDFEPGMFGNLNFTGFRFSGRAEFFRPDLLGGLMDYLFPVYAFRLGFAKGCGAGACDMLNYLDLGEKFTSDAKDAATAASLLMKMAVPKPEGRDNAAEGFLEVTDMSWKGVNTDAR